ncbi:hypothetical protein TREMEDRAFT_58159 [Tremella mesenterica DSM 1558]|uniref:uncharacterized protein n=1 Tax=Tremella mesenterica (strain ATCC 24925 / CBS 8224 / DSM 1558 / NBRC 9311 / NRRL Y-6157 / RJB 2259-6 / UBC 559-6) TaxID=578456 RepID=UPI0003F4995C|nr:uncharacterized protein TREMEDRAFT_58159 [Tremella mesenterica DSM 1558]EIW72016.1 hypothetical protein TREMEDRAFT_58159 [Tremella mesenterica DSM 1558]
MSGVSPSRFSLTLDDSHDPWPDSWDADSHHFKRDGNPNIFIYAPPGTASDPSEGRLSFPEENIRTIAPSDLHPGLTPDPLDPSIQETSPDHMDEAEDEDMGEAEDEIEDKDGIVIEDKAENEDEDEYPLVLPVYFAWVT